MRLFKHARASYALSLILCAVLLGALAVPALAGTDTPRSDRASEAQDSEAQEKAKAKKAERRKAAQAAAARSASRGNEASAAKSDNASSRGEQASAAKSDNATSAQSEATASSKPEKGAKDERVGAASEENSPAGNKGSMKVRPVGTAAHPPRNYAHLPCVVQVDFYGSPHSGATLTAVSHAPTAPTGQTLLTDTMTFTQSSPNPRGNELVGTTTLDFTSAVAGLTYHEQQGYHVKLTAVQDGPQGGDVKHKVFWIDCGAPVIDEAAESDAEIEEDVVTSDMLGSEAEAEAEAEVEAANSDRAAGEVMGLSGSAEHTQVAGVMVERERAAAEDARVLGQAAAAGPRSARVLAATGMGVLALAVLGLVGLGGGAGMLRRFRR